MVVMCACFQEVLQALQGELAEVRCKLKDAQRRTTALKHKLRDAADKDKTQLLDAIEVSMNRPYSR